MNKLIIIGASGHGKVVADIAVLNGYKDIAFLDDDLSKTFCGGFPVIGTTDMIVEGDIFVAIGNPAVREILSKNRNIITLIHPNAVTKVRLDGKVVDDKTIRTANVFLMAFVFLFVFSLMIISFDGFDLITSFTAVAATMNNIGPGLGEVGPLGGFSNFSILSKWVLIVDMIAGRLELFPILIILSPNTWRRK